MKHISVAIVLALVALNAGAHLIPEWLEAACKAFGCTPEMQILVEKTISIFASLGGVLALVTDTRAVLASWMRGLGLMPSA